MAPRMIRSATTLTVLPLAALAITVPAADAGDRWTSRSSSEQATAEWTEYGELPNVEGNVHVGYLKAETSSTGGDVFGKVLDYFCEEGEVPGGGGHDGHVGSSLEHEEGPTCDFLGKRSLEGGDVSFTMDRKLDAARLTGTLLVDNHGSSAAPPVDMIWTGLGDLSQNAWYEKGSEGGYNYVYKYESTSREATVTGYIGAMGFADDSDDESSGVIARTKSFERGSTR